MNYRNYMRNCAVIQQYMLQFNVVHSMFCRILLSGVRKGHVIQMFWEICFRNTRLTV